MAHDIDHRICDAARRIMCGYLKIEHVKAEHVARVKSQIRAYEKSDREEEEREARCESMAARRFESAAYGDD